MGEKGVSISDSDFRKRREQALVEINAMDRNVVHDQPERQGFFNAVYDRASGDPAFVPWADLEEKDHLRQWLADKNRIKSSSIFTAIDVACGLGDNAEALAAAGYETTAFDLSQKAIDWAKDRFPDTRVTYRAADLFHMPQEWNKAFDLVHECYTLQSMPPQMLPQVAGAIASLVKPGGTLLVYSRTRPDGEPADGPPWPLEEKSVRIFSDLGFEPTRETRFEINRHGRIVPHIFFEWQRSGVSR
jgi:ubiquinone/menaquinone biosynthesis C-methylase UbiE